MNAITQDATPMSRDLHPESERQRFCTYIAENSGIVWKVARTYCWHEEDRVDLQQEIVTQLWSAFAKYDSNLRFSTWMYRIALNVAISYVRRHSLRTRHMVPYDDKVHVATDPHEQPNDDPRLELLQQFLEGLDPLNRALMLLYLEEHSHQHIASILGISKTNVATKISRLKKRIQVLSAQNEPGDTHGTQ